MGRDEERSALVFVGVEDSWAGPGDGCEEAVEVPT